MSADDPTIEPKLPGHDHPSAEVLDELLRAFSIETEDTRAHRAVDLHSPEVDELLAPKAAPTPPATPVPEPPAVVDPASPEAPAITIEKTDETDETAPDDTDDTDDPTDDGLPARDDVPAATGVAGDPFLGGPSPAPAEGDDEEPGPSTITIVDEGIPDAVYIGGNLTASDTSRSTVVIEDHPSDPAATTMSVEDASAATRIEPRLRERRLAVRRATGRKRLQWAIAASVVILLVVAGLAVVGSGLFAVEAVEVAGNENSDEAALAAIVTDLEGTPVLLVDEDSFERKIETLPWVDEARISTKFPDRATIEIRERVPAAAFQGPDQQWRLIDDEGRVLALSAEPPAGYLPVTSDDLPDVDAGEYAPRGLGDAATLARSLTPLMLARVQSISVAPDRSDLRMRFIDGTEVRFGRSDDGLVQKLVRLETTLNDLGEERVSYIDVSTNEVGTG